MAAGMSHLRVSMIADWFPELATPSSPLSLFIKASDPVSSVLLRYQVLSSASFVAEYNLVYPGAGYILVDPSYRMGAFGFLAGSQVGQRWGLQSRFT